MISTGVGAQAFIASSKDAELASSVISYDAVVEVEIAKLYQSELQNSQSKMAQYLAQFNKKTIEVKVADIVLVNSKKIGGLTIGEYILPIRTEGKSSPEIVAQIAVLYVSDMSDEEMGLSTRIYFQNFMGTELK